MLLSPLIYEDGGLCLACPVMHRVKLPVYMTITPLTRPFVRGALKTAVNEGRNKVDSMRSSLETLLRLLKYMSSPFQNILRMCKYHLFNQVLYGVMTSAKNRTASITCAKNRSVSTEDQRGLTSHSSLLFLFFYT